MKKLIFAILTILFLSNTADAGVFFRRGGGGFFRQPCRTSCVATPAVCKTVVPVFREQVIIEAPPLIYPVLVPAYQFQYVAPCVVPQGQPVMGANPVMGNGSNMALPNQNDKIRELAKALLEEMSRQSSENANDDGPPVAQGPITQGFHAPLPNNNLGMNELVKIALAKNCSACHTGSASKGDMMIFSQPGVLNPNVSWGQIREVVKTSKMPPKDSQFRLNVDEAAAIIALANNLARN